jgi:hypothetical protein
VEMVDRGLAAAAYFAWSLVPVRGHSGEAPASGPSLRQRWGSG